MAQATAARARRLTAFERGGRARHRRRASCRPRLLEHVDLVNLWLPGELSSDLVEYRHDLLAKASELLLGLPDPADFQVPFGAEQDVQRQSIRGPCPSALYLVSHFIVLLAGQAGWLIRTRRSRCGERTVLTRAPPMVRWMTSWSTQNVTVTPARAARAKTAWPPPRGCPSRTLRHGQQPKHRDCHNFTRIVSG